MISGPITMLAARSRQHDLAEAARRHSRRVVENGRTPVTRVTLRHASAADAERLRILAELDSHPVPTGSALVAEVDGRLRAALPLDGGEPLADPFHRGAELLELLRMRAAQLAH